MSERLNMLLKRYPFFLIAGIMLLLLAGGFYALSYRDIYFRVTPTVDPYMTADWSGFEQFDKVHTEVVLLTGFFSFESTTGDVNDMSTMVSKTYALPNVFISNGTITISEFMGIKVDDNDDIAEYDQVVRKSISWWNDSHKLSPIPTSSIVLNGYLREMSDEEQQHLKEYVMVTWSLSESEAEEYICPYVVEYYTNERIPENRTKAVACLLVGSIVTGFGIYGARTRLSKLSREESE